MGLKDTLKNAAGTVFTAIGDIKESVNYYTHGSTTYDVSAGVPVNTTSNKLVSMVFLEHNNREIDNEKVLPGDKKALAVYASFGGIALDMRDHIKRVEAGASVRYNVADYSVDPVEAVVEFNLRRP